jgi:hypothetical protein
MAITLIAGTLKSVGAYDKEQDSVTYEILNQPGAAFADVSSSTVGITAGIVSDVPKQSGVFAVNSTGTINVYSISLQDEDENEYLSNTSFDLSTDGDVDIWTASSDTGTQSTTVFTDGQGDNYVQMSASGGGFQGLYQTPALQAGKPYTITVDAQIPIGSTLRIDDRHFAQNPSGAPREGFYVDIIGDGVRRTHTLTFYPIDTVELTGLPAAAINGGPGSLDYGLNASTSTKQVTPKRITYDHPVTIRATDAEGNSTDESFKVRTTVPWRYIANLSHGYVLGGYKGAESWRHVCKIDNSTDTSLSLGNQLAGSANTEGFRYTDGSTDIWTGQCIGYSGNAYAASNKTESYNMITETAYSVNAQHAQESYAQQGASDYTRRFGYSHSGSAGTVCEKFNLSTHTRVGNIGQATSWQYHGGGMTETHMYFAQAGSGTRDYYDFATETRVGNGWTLASSFSSGSTHTKAISMWDNRGWYVGYNVVATTWIVNFNNGTMVQSANQTTNNGEGNCLTGMNHGYQCGGYNGAQNNHCDRFDFVTETISRAAAADNKGSPGASSGVATWAEL